MDTHIATIFPSNTPTAPADNNEPPNPETQPNKRRRKKSIVWEYFTVETVGAGCSRACCKQCKKSFAYITGSKLAGTSHLKRHITQGICPVYRQKNQQTPFTPGSKPAGATEPPKRRYRASPGFASIPFNQNLCSHEIIKMIIMHEYPLHMVEHPGFIDFVRTLQPQFNVASFNTIQGDCVAMYLREKQILSNLINRIPGRVNLTLDLWTSDHTVGYAIVTGHFIDGEWNLHHMILNVVLIPSPETDVAFNNALGSCLLDWHLENKLLTLTLDQSFSNEAINGNLRGFLSVKNPHMLHGQLVMGNCYARVIGRLAQDALEAVGEAVNKIRDSVKYVKTSNAHEEIFFNLKERLQVPSRKHLFIDDQSKWNTTYHMLAAASELKEVFACLEATDPDYRIAPSMDDWKQIEILCIYLRCFYEAVNILTSPANLNASIFYHEVTKLQLELMQSAMSEDSFISNLTKPLGEIFDEYWKQCFVVLAIAVIMDPRFKMKLVEFTFTRIYGEDGAMWIKAVEDGIHDLFLEYVVQTLPMPETYMEEGNEAIPKTEISQDETQEGPSQEEVPSQGSQDMTLISIGDGFSDFEVYINELTTTQPMKSELHQYLEESLLPRTQDFNLLEWWEKNEMKYPTLSKMASDILSIPFSTVSADSVFDTANKKIDSYRASLRPVTVEALICAKDWLQYEILPPEAQTTTTTTSSNAIVKMEY